MILANFQTFNEGKKVDLVQLATQAISEKDYDDFLEAFCRKTGSMAEVWMSEDDMKKLAKHCVTDSYDFKAEGFGADEDYDKETQKMIKKGWKIFAEEENMGQYDIVYFRLKSKKLRKIDQKLGVLSENTVTEINEGYYNIPNRPSYVLDASKLHFHKDENSFSVEVSELGRSFNPLYKGNDEIIVIENPKTGKSCEYYKANDKRDAEGELQYTVYKPKAGSIGAGSELIIWND